jgi:hypothetical protein
MLNLRKNPKPQKEAPILSLIVEQQSLSITNFIGYIILVLAFLDYAVILIPPQLFNPTWEFQTIGQFVEHSWAILLGLMFIFYRRHNDHIGGRELHFLAIISRLTLFVGIIYFLATPLLISDALRINNNNSTLVNQQLSLQLDRVQAFEAQLNQQSQAQLEQLIKSYSQNQDRNQDKSKATSPEEFKAKILADVKAKEQLSKQQIQQTLKNRKINLVKNTFKWALGTILTGFSLLFIWNSTQWVRVLQREHNQGT